MPNYYAPYYYQQPQMMPQQTQQNPAPPQPQIQNGGFVSVRNETEARNYPIAIGTSVTFKDENAPYIYNKTMGFSQLEAPKFDKYRLVKEEASEGPSLAEGDVVDLEPVNASIKSLNKQVEAIWGEIEGLKKKAPARARKKEADEDDE